MKKLILGLNDTNQDTVYVTMDGERLGCINTLLDRLCKPHEVEYKVRTIYFDEEVFEDTMNEDYFNTLFAYADYNSEEFNEIAFYVLYALAG